MATLNYELGKPKQNGERRVTITLSHRGKRKRIPTNISVGKQDLSRSGKIISTILHLKQTYARTRQEYIRKRWLFDDIVASEGHSRFTGKGGEQLLDAIAKEKVLPLITLNITRCLSKPLVYPTLLPIPSLRPVHDKDAQRPVSFRYGLAPALAVLRAATVVR